MIGQSLGGLLSDYERQRQHLLMQQAQVPAWAIMGTSTTSGTNAISFATNASSNEQNFQPEPSTVLLLEDDDAA